MTAVSVRDLQMTYSAPVREAGLAAAFRSLLRREFRQVEAVQGISFTLEPGEVVGFIGPNGAGKTTTLKILSGVLHPTGGEVSVLGFTPSRREYRFLRQIAMVRGSRPLGAPGELTVGDALRFQQLIYEVDEADYRRNLAELVAMLDLEPILQRQVRALSLGQRMRAGLAWALLYRPRVLFLDEPTLGLDVTAAAAMRRFLSLYTRETGATVMLTSHYMADVEALCPRIILIDKGRLLYDGALQRLAHRLAPYKLLKVRAVDGLRPVWSQFGQVVGEEDGRCVLQVHRDHVPATTARILAQVAVADITVEEAPLEQVMDQVYREGVTA
ncbi:MAG: ABC transporter ATP-binding protein [Bacillota bacterium]